MAALIWITGLSGSGKTTIAKEVVDHLRLKLIPIIHLDGDKFREVMGNDVDHSPAGRLANAYRIAKMSHLLVEQEIFVVCSTMSLYSEIHDLNREKVKRYLEIFVECDLSELERRDQKGLYSGVKVGTKSNVIGVDLPFDRPANPDLIINNTKKDDLQDNISLILKILEKHIIS